mmetsp:Transcript_18891/g.31245  ORF Transcript_18891/g.31245 Transcript_18891/m.31245 type:complete len:266 (-) Transcript_18891:243-1040(-)
MRASRSSPSTSSAAFATLVANSLKDPSLATKSVSQLTSTKTALLPLVAKTIFPSAATRLAFLSALASPFLRRDSLADSWSPLASIRALLQSIIPAPVASRSCLMVFGVTSPAAGAAASSAATGAAASSATGSGAAASSTTGSGAAASSTTGSGAATSATGSGAATGSGLAAALASLARAVASLAFSSLAALLLALLSARTVSAAAAADKAATLASFFTTLAACWVTIVSSIVGGTPKPSATTPLLASARFVTLRIICFRSFQLHF